MPPGYFEAMPDIRASHQQGVKQQQDLQSMLDELKKMQLAAMMGQSKPSVVLTDQTDLGDKIGELTDKMVETIGKLRGTNIDEMGIVTSLTNGVQAIKDAQDKAARGHDKHLRAVLDAIKGLNFQPQVNVKTDPVDFSPLQEMLASDDEDKIDFDDYKAQDINNDDANKQYVGFLNPDGDWYIIENDVKGNKMRYVFGSGNYAKAFAKAATYQYKLLNEAIDAA